MGISIKKINVQAQLWTIPGPLLVCSILLIIVLRPVATPMILPITAVCGVLACNIWKWRGVAFSSAFLTAMMVYALQSQPSQYWVWTIVLSLSIASTYVLTVLCSEEAHHAWESLNKGSNDHKQTVAHLNERFQLVQNKLIAEQTELNLQISQMQQQLLVKEEKQRANEQLLKLARSEMTAIYTNQEKLVQELFQSRQNSVAMEVRINELNELVDPESVTLNKVAKATVIDLQSKLQLAHQEIQQLAQQIEHTEGKQQTAAQQANALTTELMANIENLSEEKYALEKNLLGLRNELEAAALQGLEKSQVIESEQKALQTLQASSAEMELKLKEQIEELKARLLNHEAVNEKINDLQDQVHLEQAEIKRLQQQYEELQQEKTAAEKLYAKAQADASSLLQEIERLSTQCQQLETLSDEKNALQDQYLNLQNQMVFAQQLYTEVKANETALLQKNEELLKQCQDLDKLRQEHQHLHQKLSDLEALQQENQELLQKLAHQKESVVILSAEKETLIEQLQEIQAKQQEALEVVVDDRELRRLEGLYQQLRNQFAEKTEVLASTRKELFTTQEKLLALQKDLDEAKIYDDSESSESLHSLIAAAESELALAEQQHAIEINRLHEVIDSLMARA